MILTSWFSCHFDFVLSSQVSEGSGYKYVFAFDVWVVTIETIGSKLKFVCLFVSYLFASYLFRVGHSTDMSSLLQGNLLGGKKESSSRSYFCLQIFYDVNFSNPAKGRNSTSILHVPLSLLARLNARSGELKLQRHESVLVFRLGFRVRVRVGVF